MRTNLLNRLNINRQYCQPENMSWHSCGSFSVSNISHHPWGTVGWPSPACLSRIMNVKRRSCTASLATARHFELGSDVTIWEPLICWSAAAPVHMRRTWRSKHSAGIFLWDETSWPLVRKASNANSLRKWRPQFVSIATFVVQCVSLLCANLYFFFRKAVCLLRPADGLNYLWHV